MKRAGLICLLTGLLFISGCATTSLTQSGFLNDYSNFEQGIKTPGVLVNFPQGREEAYARAKTYQSFIVDPLVVQLMPERNKKINIDPETIKEITDYFHNELAQGLSKDGYTIVEQPGVGVMRIRTALTDLVASKPYLNLHWTTKLSKAGVGGASLEAEFIDSLSGERIAAVIYARQGRGIMIFKGLSKWGYAKDSLQQWALIVRRRLAVLRENQ